MEEKNNFFDLVQVFMEKVRKEFQGKKGNEDNLVYNKEIVDSLFNLLNYQITLINQIFLFNENNKVGNDNFTLDNLMNINKDILVTMIQKFFSVLNSSSMKLKNNGKNKANSNIINKNINNTTFAQGKVINLLYSPGNNNNYLVSNSFAKDYSTIKKNIEKEFNSTISYSQYTPLKKFEPTFDSEKNSYKFLKNKNMIYTHMKNKNYKNIFDKLYNDNSKCDHDEKRKSKMNLYQSYCKSTKDIFVDLNSDNNGNNFNGKRSINYQK